MCACVVYALRQVGPEHTAEGGLTITNYNGEHAVVSGGTPIKIGKADWKPYKVRQHVQWGLGGVREEACGRGSNRRRAGGGLGHAGGSPRGG